MMDWRHGIDLAEAERWCTSYVPTSQGSVAIPDCKGGWEMGSKFVPKRKGNMAHVLFSAIGSFGTMPMIIQFMAADTEAGVSKLIL